ncbi:MAG: toll/interleukin-1 receptor domain-containing protein [Bacteroidota bacterium]
MSQTATYDTFLSHSHEDAELVELIAHKLEEEHALRVWLDKWILIPGETLRQELSKGLDNSKTCVVIIGNDTQKGWFEEEINKAIDKQTRDKSFRVIPVLLPNANPRFVQDFLENRRYVRFFEKIVELIDLF